MATFSLYREDDPSRPSQFMAWVKAVKAKTNNHTTHTAGMKKINIQSSHPQTKMPMSMWIPYFSSFIVQPHVLALCLGCSTRQSGHIVLLSLDGWTTKHWVQCKPRIFPQTGHLVNGFQCVDSHTFFFFQNYLVLV